MQNLAPVSALRLGLGAETLRRKHPRLIAGMLPLLVIGGGTNELQRMIIARQLLQKYAI